MAANSETIVVPKNYRLREFVESRAFNAFVTAVIIVIANCRDELSRCDVVARFDRP